MFAVGCWTELKTGSEPAIFSELNLNHYFFSPLNPNQNWTERMNNGFRFWTKWLEQLLLIIRGQYHWGLCFFTQDQLRNLFSPSPPSGPCALLALIKDSLALTRFSPSQQSQHYQCFMRGRSMGREANQFSIDVLLLAGRASRVQGWAGHTFGILQTIWNSEFALPPLQRLLPCTTVKAHARNVPPCCFSWCALERPRTHRMCKCLIRVGHWQGCVFDHHPRRPFFWCKRKRKICVSIFPGGQKIFCCPALHDAPHSTTSGHQTHLYFCAGVLMRENKKERRIAWF